MKYTLRQLDHLITDEARARYQSEITALYDQPLDGHDLELLSSPYRTWVLGLSGKVILESTTTWGPPDDYIPLLKNNSYSTQVAVFDNIADITKKIRWLMVRGNCTVAYSKLVRRELSKLNDILDDHVGSLDGECEK